MKPKPQWEVDLEIEQKTREHHARNRAIAGLPKINPSYNLDPSKNRSTVIGRG